MHLPHFFGSDFDMLAGEVAAAGDSSQLMEQKMAVSSRTQKPRKRPTHHVNFGFHEAYQLNSDALLSLFKLVQEFMGNQVTMWVTLEDEHQVHSIEPGELFDDMYVRARKIVGVSIDGLNYTADPARRINIRFGNSSYRAPVDVEVSGERDPATILREKMQNILSANRLWYSFLILRKSAKIVALVIIYVILFSIFVAVHHKYGIADNLSKEAAGNLILIETFAGLGLLIWAKVKLFPAIIFDIGRSAMVGRRINYVRRFVFGGVLLTLILGILSSYIASKIP